MKLEPSQVGNDISKLSSSVECFKLRASFFRYFPFTCADSTSTSGRNVD